MSEPPSELSSQPWALRLSFEAGVGTREAALAALGAALAALGAGLGGFANFFTGFGAAFGLADVIGSGAATGATDKGAKTSAMAGFGNSQGAVPRFKSAATLM